jgi:hypothetical protein
VARRGHRRGELVFSRNRQGIGERYLIYAALLRRL